MPTKGKRTIRNAPAVNDQRVKLPHRSESWTLILASNNKFLASTSFPAFLHSLLIFSFLRPNKPQTKQQQKVRQANENLVSSISFSSSSSSNAFTTALHSAPCWPFSTQKGRYDPSLGSGVHLVIPLLG